MHAAIACCITYLPFALPRSVPAAQMLILEVTHEAAAAASLTDSSFRCLAVDLLSQLVISLADFYVARNSPNYPVGRARLEALGVIGCACIMSVASLEVVQLSAVELYDGFVHGTPQRRSSQPVDTRGPPLSPPLSPTQLHTHKFMDCGRVFRALRMARATVANQH